MRIDLLFGFLGSGKTTLAQRILEEWGTRERLALIVNEFGDVGVDGEILRGNDIDMVELNSGCLCCTLKGSLLNAIEELGAQTPVDHIVIEATGVAEPEEMLKTFADPSFKENYTIGPITTVVDAPKHARIRQVLGPFYTAQVEKADIVILNKIDLGDAETLEEARQEVQDANPSAVIRFAERGDIDIGEIMEGPPSGAVARYATDGLGGSQDHAHDHGDGHDHDHTHDHSHAPADSFVLDVTAPLSRAALESFFAEAPEGLWRAKGFFEVDGTPSLLQFTMGQLEITDAEPRERAYLVVIGHDLDRDAIATRFAACADEGSGS